MRRGVPVVLSPSRPDIAVSRAIRRHATPLVERVDKAITFLADEKPLLGAALTYWLYSRGFSASPRRAAQADHLLASIALSAALPHLLKRLVDRERPDRKLMHGRPRHGIPRSGNAEDSFPSGHAMHLGAIAAVLSRTESPAVGAVGWISALALASTRLLLLAHYLSDVIGGLFLGACLEWLVARITYAGREP